ncbi:MAG: two pore domain potassium channel family protein [Acetobacteraceae bacterium]|nr:two pore domain potassium channel family protein [Acetobacteraceae bacterium]
MPLFLGAGLLATVLLAFILQDAFEVMLLPRRVRRRVRFMWFYFRTAWATCKQFALLVAPGRRRESLLSHFGALSMLGLFVIWATGLIGGFGLLEWSLQGPANRSPLPEQIYMSGVTFFTVGFGDVVPHSMAARLVAVLEAGTGLGFIAVVIGYLPVLYQLFARREAHVIQLDGRAGSPPTAAAMLCRHAESEGLGKLDELLRDWEVWAAELLESHLSYPMLAYYRSQHDDQSWLAAIAAVMDCCALILVGVKGLSPLQARMTFTMARQVVVEMARSFQIAPSRYDGGDRLPADSYARMEAAFAEAGVEWDGSPDARASLQALRATYEPLLDGLGRYMLLTLPGWVPEAGAADHWGGGHRGLLARRLVEQLSDRTSAPTLNGKGDGETTWRTLRKRLR